MQKAVQLYIVKMYVVCPLSYFMLCFLILQGNFAMSGDRDACSKHHSYHFLDEITVTLNWTLPAKKARHRNFNKKGKKKITLDFLSWGKNQPQTQQNQTAVLLQWAELRYRTEHCRMHARVHTHWAVTVLLEEIAVSQCPVGPDSHWFCSNDVCRISSILQRRWFKFWGFPLG